MIISKVENIVLQTYNAPNAAPIAQNDVASGNEDTIISGNVLSNDTTSTNQPLPVGAVVSLVNGPASGILALQADGNYTFTPLQDFNGPISFTYKVTLNGVDSNVATVNINVAAVNDAPIVSAPVALDAIAEDSGARVITQAELLANASDVDNVNLVAIQLTIASGNGQLVDNNDGTWTYTPALNDDSNVSFDYQVSDGQVAVNATASLDITPVNDAAIISAPVVNLIETDAVLNTGGTLSITDVDSPLTFNAQSNILATYGTFNLLSNGDWTYVTSSAHNEFVAGQTYTDTLNITSSDGTPSVITVNILGTDEAVSVIFNPTSITNGAVVNLPGNNDTLDTRGLTAVDYTQSNGNLINLSNNDNMTLTGVENFILKGGDQLRLDAAGNYQVTLDTAATSLTIITLVEGNAINMSLYRGLTAPVINMEFNDNGTNLTNTSHLDLANHAYSFNATAIEYMIIAAAVGSVVGPIISPLQSYTYQLFDNHYTGATDAAITTKIESLANIGASYFTNQGAIVPLNVKIVLGVDITNPINQAGVTDVVDFSDILQGVTFNDYNLISQSTIISALADDGKINQYELIHYETVILTAGNDTISGSNGFAGNSISTIDGSGGLDTLNLGLFGAGGGSIIYDGSLNLLTTISSAPIPVITTITLLNVENIIGTALADTFISGSSNETFTGGDGLDSFVFKNGNGQDVITDFNVNAEIIDVSDFGFANLTTTDFNSMDQVGVDVVINFDGTNMLTLQNVAIADVTNADFNFL